MINSHILDLKTKTLTYPGAISDEKNKSAEDTEFKKAFLKEIEGYDIAIKKDREGYQHLYIHKEGQKNTSSDVEILTLNDGCITALNLPTTTEIGDSFLTGEQKLKSLTAPHLTSLGNFCFGNVFSLTSLNLPSLKKCGNNCVVGIRNLKSLNLPALEQMGNSCFQGDNDLKTLNLPSLTEMGRYCFSVSNRLKSAILPHIEKMGDSCFFYAASLRSFYAPLLEEQPQKFCKGINPLKKMILWATRKIRPLGSGISAILKQTQPKNSVTLAKGGISGILRSAEDAKSATPDKGISAKLKSTASTKQPENPDKTSFFRQLRNWILPRQ